MTDSLQDFLDLLLGEPLGGEKDALPALENRGQYYRVRIEDGGGNTRTIEFARRGASVNAVYSKFSAVIDATIKSIEFLTKYSPETFVQPVSGSQVEAKAKFRIYDSENEGIKHTVYMPSPDPSIFLTLSGDGANVIDPENLDVIQFAAMFDVGSDLYLPDGSLGGGFAEGKRVTRKSKRG